MNQSVLGQSIPHFFAHPHAHGHTHAHLPCSTLPHAETIIGFILVAICWGLTNPFIRKGTKGLDQVKPGPLGLAVSQFFYLATRWQYVLPLALNLSGSIVYYYTLGKSELSLAVPIANSLTFLLTTLTAWALGEETGGLSTIIGTLTVLLGVGFCVSDRL
ncbi:MAG: transmembrane protein [Piptocephalis tieghemiana]|nr:MAG: transmembrane protein [Piptocephalis tieghemiana]